MRFVDEFKSAFTFFISASPSDKLTIILFILVLSGALLFQWLWLRERNHRLRLESKAQTERAEDTAIATFNKVKRLAPREPLRKLALKVSKMASWILPSTHQTKRPDARDTTKEIKPSTALEHNTEMSRNQSQNTRW